MTHTPPGKGRSYRSTRARFLWWIGPAGPLAPKIWAGSAQSLRLTRIATDNGADFSVCAQGGPDG